MVLNGDPDMVLKSISIDGAALAPSAYDKTPAMLTILAPPAEFEVRAAGPSGSPGRFTRRTSGSLM